MNSFSRYASIIEHESLKQKWYCATNESILTKAFSESRIKVEEQFQECKTWFGQIFPPVKRRSLRSGNEVDFRFEASYSCITKFRIFSLISKHIRSGRLNAQSASWAVGQLHNHHKCRSYVIHRFRVEWSISDVEWIVSAFVPNFQSITGHQTKSASQSKSSEQYQHPSELAKESPIL